MPSTCAGCGPVSDVLAFDLTVRKGGFTLEAAAEIPLAGITAVSGPSGSGKTTLLRALAGLEPHAQGTITFAGESWSRKAAPRRGVGYVFQDAMLFPHLDVRANLEYGARRRGATEDFLAAVIEELDLRRLLDRVPDTLSGGERRRVALGRALASAPRILFLDEPLTGLDRARKTDLMPYIARAVAGFEVPAIYVTHSAMEIAYLADRTLTMEAGALTSWTGAAPRLIGRVVNVAPGQINLAIGEQVIWLSGHGALGEYWALPMGQDLVISTQDPGWTNAAVTLAARVIEAAPGAGHVRVELEGQHLVLPWRRSDGAVPLVGSQIWASLPRVMARPVQMDGSFDSP